MATELQYTISPAMVEAANDWLDGTWRELRNGAGPARRAYLAGAVDALRSLGLLDDAEQEAWIARGKRCPGHDDEGGRDWCAYGCDMRALGGSEPDSW
jgi:hypothetical protein